MRTKAMATCLTAVLTVLATAGWAAEDPAERLDRGRTSFRTYCSNCHGDGGRGDGKMAEILRVPPADLTRLAVDDGGAFPSERVYRAIDGRDEVRGHGRREMPVWGIGFRDPGRDSDQEAEVRQRILDLVAFIASIQEPGAGDGEGETPAAASAGAADGAQQP
jgi:mono/diheme cytochrome c family protein